MEKIREVSDIEIAFGGDMKSLIPSNIPKEFYESRNKFHKIVAGWFYHGMDKDTVLYPKKGVDPKLALRHIRAILVSFQPKHEDKMAGVAYLLSEWFNDIKVEKKGED